MPVSTSTAILFESESQHRALLACVCVSVALHALALFSFPGFPADARANTPAMLTALFAPTLSLPEAAPTVKKATPPPSRPPKSRKEDRPEALRPVITDPSLSAPPISQQAVPNLESTASLPAKTASTAPSNSPDSTPGAPEPQAPYNQGEAIARSPSNAIDAGTLDQYRLALIDAARRYKRYPAQAMEKGWQGRVEVRLVIGADGVIQAAIVKTSSGYRILDDQAMDMVKRGKPLTQIPPALRGREFTVDIPVIFDLQTG